MKIYGSGDVVLNINNNTLKFNDVENYIEVNSDIMECYKNTMNCNSKMIGEFPIFNTGKNIITYTGNIDKIEITPNWRCL